ncbi:hypothetical protein F5884DRAFT_802316 [Xylogone sp. PMI_703]|nr:hypothetical protein F5884DRAFT_802316 [Xylogone sp. PMI_703]
MFAWDSFTDLLDGDTGNIDLLGLDWNAFDHFEFNEAALDDKSSSTGSTLVPSKESQQVESSSKKEDRNPVPEKGTKRRGRPKSSLTKADANDRRKNQVRLAQQTYRRKNEGRLKLLTEEVNNLQKQLIGMEKVADELFRVISLSNLSKPAKSAVQNLYITAQQHRLPLEIDTLSDTRQKATSSNKDVIGASISNTSHPSRTTAGVEITPSLSSNRFGINYSPAQFFQQSSPADSLPQISSIIQCLETPGQNIQSSILQLEEISMSSFAFSLRLRFEALKEAYNRIARQETSYKLLYKSFRYCLFSSTREQIKYRVQSSMHETLKQAHQYASLSVRVNKETNIYSSRANHVDKITTLSEFDELYVNTDGVDKYLSEQGLNIRPGSSFIVFKPPPSNGANVSTLFDEICQKGGIEINVTKLISELLNRMVCLTVEPGIRPSDIDDAIQSTVLADI